MKISLETLPPTVASRLSTQYAIEEIEANGSLTDAKLRIYEALTAQGLLAETKNRVEFWRDLATQMQNSEIVRDALQIFEENNRRYEAMFEAGLEEANHYLSSLNPDFLREQIIDSSQFGFWNEEMLAAFV